MKNKIDIIDWCFKWLALISAVLGVIVIPGSRIAWGCVVLWIIANMIQKKNIKLLEEERDSLISENRDLYDKLHNTNTTISTAKSGEKL